MRGGLQLQCFVNPAAVFALLIVVARAVLVQSVVCKKTVALDFRPILSPSIHKYDAVYQELDRVDGHEYARTLLYNTAEAPCPRTWPQFHQQRTNSNKEHRLV